MTQLEFDFLEEMPQTEFWELKREIANVRRGLFARHSSLAHVVAALCDELRASNERLEAMEMRMKEFAQIE